MGKQGGSKGCLWNRVVHVSVGFLVASAAGASEHMTHHAELSSRRLHTLTQLPTQVTTPQQFIDAVTHGDEAIEIRRHLDLTAVSIRPPPDSPTEGSPSGGSGDRVGPVGFSKRLPFNSTTPSTDDDDTASLSRMPFSGTDVPSSVRSIRGNCEARGAGEGLAVMRDGRSPKLLPLKRAQCILVVDAEFLHLLGTSKLWLDGLYLRLQRPEGDAKLVRTKLLTVGEPADTVSHPQNRPPSPSQHSPALWMTGVTLQGDGGAAIGLYAFGDVYAHECTFSNLGGGTIPTTIVNTTAVFRDCVFKHNTLPYYGTVLAAGGAAAVQLQRCALANNDLYGSRYVLWDVGGSLFFADDSVPLWRTNTAVVTPPSIQSAAHRFKGHRASAMLLSSIPPTHTFLSYSDEWLIETRDALQEISRFTGRRPDEVPEVTYVRDTVTPALSDGALIALILGSTVCVLGLILCGFMRATWAAS